MKWTQSIKNKLFAAGLLSVLILLIFFNNLSERKNAYRINEAITTIFDDRLIAESYLFEYQQNALGILDKLDDALLTEAGKQRDIGMLLTNFDEMGKAFLKTKLTEEENTLFNRLQTQYSNIRREVSHQNFQAARNHLKEANGTLKYLSELQVNEAKNQMAKIKQFNNTSTVNLQFEIAVLVLIGMAMQALVFAAKTPNPQQDSARNLLN